MTPIILTAGDLTVHILTWGAVVQDVRLSGVDHSLTCGRDALSDYQGGWRYHGALIGPIVNRISNARVKIDGMMHELERNEDGRVHLHSGKHGTHRQNWTVVDQTDNAVILEIKLPDGMCGLPGNRVVRATYTVSAPATLTMDIIGTTDADTVMSFANHSYWNLDGAADWSGHRLQIDADRFLPCTPDNYPTGEIVDVTDTPMDFRLPKQVVVGKDHFDNNFCLSDNRLPLRDVLTLAGVSGIKMTLATTETGVQIYDGRDAPAPFKGLAIEAQSWPDAPNNRKFPSVRLPEGCTYEQTTQWRFTR
ncbi:MAG: galactose mutarotase [Yoonia sp.]|nr:galactose mutarotase [Yoonia sp.]